MVQDGPLLAVNGVLTLIINGRKDMGFTVFFSPLPEDGAIVIWPADFRLKLGPCVSPRSLMKVGWVEPG